MLPRLADHSREKFFYLLSKKVFSSEDILILYFSVFRLASGDTNPRSCNVVPGFARKGGLFKNRPSVAKFIVTDWGEKVDSGMWLLYRPARLHCNGNSVYIYSFSGNCAASAPISTDPSWEYIIRSQTHECGNWD
jgi:hypothetical protein